MKYGLIPAELYRQLTQITPSRDSDLEYFPCLVTLKDTRRVDRVYIVDFNQYKQSWVTPPEEDRHMRSVYIENVVKIEESPSRLPPRIANELYKEGESGMGYYVFTLEFKGGSHQAYLTGGAVDFVPLPEGKSWSGVTRVLPHTGRNDPDLKHDLDYYWCLYDGIEK